MTEEDLVDRVFEELMHGPIGLLASDQTVVISDLVDGVSFTHRISEVELTMGSMAVGFDEVFDKDAIEAALAAAEDDLDSNDALALIQEK